MINYAEQFNEFAGIVKRLRKECPWDREQTHDSIKANTIEEAYEVAHAIDEHDYDELQKELGDLLLHVLFHSAIAEDENHFNLSDVISGIQEKLIRRHPHVFGSTVVTDAEDVKKNWEQIKMDEGRKSVLDGLPPALPALLRATRMQEKAAKVGFDWKEKKDVWGKVEEELIELAEAEATGEREKIEDEFGDLLFALTNYSRFLNIHAEDSLRKASHKFERRFRFVEEQFQKMEKKMEDSTLDEMELYWQKSKLSQQ